MPLEADIENRMHAIHRQRNRFAYIPNFLLAAASTYFQREVLFTGSLWWISLLMISFGLAMRVFITEIIFEQWKKKLVWARGLNFFAITLVAIGWMIHFYAIYSGHGGSSVHTSNTIILIAGLITGSTVSLAADRPSFFWYVTTMSVILCGIYIQDENLMDKSIVVYIIIFYFFNASNMLAGHKQLRRSVENEIRSNNEAMRIRNLIDTVPGFVGILDKNLKFTLANKMTLSMFRDIIGKKLGTIDPRSGWERNVGDFLISDKTNIVMEQHLMDQNEKDLWVLLSIQKMEDGGAVLVSMAINELVEARGKIREQEAKAQFSAKLASLGEMAAGIAHEVNNPLTIIQGSSSIIQRLVAKDPIDRESLIQLSDRIVSTSERISKIIKSLKNLSRTGDRDPMAPVNLEELIHQSLDICRQRTVNLAIDLRLPTFTWPVFFQGREVQLGQVLLNLLSNAIDAVRPCEERWIEIKYELKPKTLEICIIDSGPGVPPEISNKIMEPFYTTKEINQGTGLGLSISKSIMREHGGDLFVDLAAPHSTFRMHLPIEEIDR